MARSGLSASAAGAHANSRSARRRRHSTALTSGTVHRGRRGAFPDGGREGPPEVGMCVPARRRILSPKEYPMKEERIQGSGGSLFVRSWQPDSPARAVVVIVPGFNSHSGYYQWTAEQLRSGGLAVYAVDLRGRGNSEGE